MISFVMGNNWNEHGSISKYTLGCIKSLRTNGLLKRRLFQFLCTLFHIQNGILEYEKNLLNKSKDDYSGRIANILPNMVPFLGVYKIKSGIWLYKLRIWIVHYFLLVIGVWKRRCGITPFWSTLRDEFLSKVLFDCQCVPNKWRWIGQQTWSCCVMHHIDDMRLKYISDKALTL